MKWKPSLLAKAALVALGLLSLGALATPLLLKRFLPPQRVRQLLVSGAQKSLHRQVRLGEVSLGLVSGLTLQDFAISETPDFAKGTFASVRSFSVKIRLAPLLRRKVVVDSISASGLSLRLFKNADGAYNFSDIAASTTTAPSRAGTPASAGVEWAIRHLRLDDAMVSYAEEGAKRAITVTGLNAKLSAFSMSGSFPAELSGRASGRWDGHGVEGAAAFSGRLDLGSRDPRRFLAEARSFEISSRGWRAQASGRIKDLSRPDLDVEFSLRGPSQKIGEGRFKGVVTPASGKNRLAAEGALSLQTASVAPAEAASLGLPAGMPLPAVKAAGEFSYSEDALRLKRVSLESPFGPIDASGTVAALLSAKPDYDMVISAKLELPAIRPAMAPWLKLPSALELPALKISGKAHLKGDALTTPGISVRGAFGSVDISGGARKLSSGHPELDLTAAVKADIPELKASDYPWTKLPASLVSPALSLEGQGRLKGDDLSLSALRVHTKAGTLEANGTVRKLTSGAPEPSLDLAAKLILPAFKSADLPLPGVPPNLLLPASQWDGSLFYSRDEVKIRSLRVVIAHNDIQINDGRIAALRSESPLVNLLVKCRQFQLEEITAVSPATREMGLSGSGFFVLGATGRLPRPVLEGKAQFKGLGATVGGLKLSAFTGTVSFNEKRIDVPNLRGAVADGQLEMNLTIKNYAQAPAVDLEASLSQFDLGKFLAAKAALAAAKPGQPTPLTPKPTRKPAPPISARGKLVVQQLVHPNAEARGLRVEWDLAGITPDQKSLNGHAAVYSSGGRFTNLGEMATQSKIVKVLIFPLTIIQKIGSIGGIRLFPDFNRVDYSELAGDYAFENGVMSLRDSHLNASVGDVKAEGTIDLPGEQLNLTVSAQVARLAPIDVAVTGPIDKPRTRVKVAKFLAEPAKQLLENIFNK